MSYPSKTIRTILKVFTLTFLIVFVVTLSLVIVNCIDLKEHREIATPDDITIMKIDLKPDPSNTELSIAGIIYSPESASPTSPALPAVIIQHGFGGIKENLLSMAINFVERGFVVATFDLRSHGESDGYFTFCDKESDDLAYAVNYLRTSFNDNYVNISGIGLIGHSIGAATVIMTSYKTDVNACVAISPASFVVGLLASFTGGDPNKISDYVGTKNPFYDPSFVDRINLTNYIVNRVNEGSNPNTKNLLICTTKGDTTVPSSTVYDFFKEIVQLESPDNETLYGSFEDHNATQCNVYPGIAHGNQQFTWESPEITKDAMNWTERAILGESGSLIRGVININDFNLENMNQNSGEIQLFYIISWLSLCTFIMLGISTLTFEKESKDFKHLPDNLDFFILSSKIKNRDNNGDMKRQNLILNCIFLVSLSIIVGMAFSYFYIPGYVGTMIPELSLRPLILFSIPVSIFLLIIWIRHKKLNSPSDAELVRILGIADDKKWFGIDSIFGIFMGLYFPAGLSIISQQLKIESFIKPVKFWSIYLISAIYVFVLIFLLSLFLYGYVMRGISMKSRHLEPLNPILGAIIQLPLTFGIAAVLFPIDPVFRGIFAYSGFVFDLNLGIVLITSLAVFAIGLAANIYAKTTKSIMIPVMICTTVVPWLLISLMPVI